MGFEVHYTREKPWHEAAWGGEIRKLKPQLRQDVGRAVDCHYRSTLTITIDTNNFKKEKKRKENIT